MKIQISNHPQFSNVEREFEFIDIKTDLVNFAHIKGFVKCYLDGKTPKGFNANGEYFELVADNTTKVDSSTGDYSLNGDMTEIDYIKNMKVSDISQNPNFTIGNVLETLVVMSVMKQDRYKRFDK